MSHTSYTLTASPPLNNLTIRMVHDELVALSFDDTSPANASLNHSTKTCLHQLSQYLAQKRESFTLPLNPQGTAWQKKAWQALLTIPYGETRSYLEIAHQIGYPTASRAVANAIGRNPIPIIIPCHRVIRNTGELGGYSAGLELKKFLLNLEQ